MSTLLGTVNERILENGLRVATQVTPSRSVAAQLRVFHGSLHEAPAEHGLAHLLEHMLVAGGSQKYSPRASDEVRASFGHYNAWTSLDTTCFVVDTLPQDIQLGVDFIGEAAFRPSLDQERLDEQRRIVLREIADEKSDSRFAARQAYSEALYGKDSPHIYFGLGTQDIVRLATRESLAQFHRKGYSPNNADLIVVGILPSNIDRIIDETFGDLPSGPGSKFLYPPHPPLTYRTILETYAPELAHADTPEEASAVIRIGFSAPNALEEDSHAVAMLTNVLGGDMSSRLFESVRNRRGLAYGISAGYDGSNNQGGIEIVAKVPSMRVDEAVQAVFEELADLRIAGVSLNEIARSRKAAQYRIAKTFETNSGMSHAIALNWDRGLTPEDILAKLDAMTPERIQAAAVRYLPASQEDNYVMSIRSPLRRK